jgi:hypothetical protein
VAILLTYATARILLAGDAEAREEEYMASGPYTGPLTVINVPKLHTLRAEVPCTADRGRFRGATSAGLGRRRAGDITSSSAFKMQRIPELHFSATVCEEPEVVLV